MTEADHIGKNLSVERERLFAETQELKAAIAKYEQHSVNLAREN